VRGGEPGVRPLQPKLKFQLFPNSSFGFAADFFWRFQIQHCHKKECILERIHWECYTVQAKEEYFDIVGYCKYSINGKMYKSCLAINYFK
jgi:hypothetical protein